MKLINFSLWSGRISRIISLNTLQLRNLNRGVETATEFVAPFVIMVVPLSAPELNYSEAVEFAVRFPVIHGLFVSSKRIPRKENSRKIPALSPIICLPILFNLWTSLVIDSHYNLNIGIVNSIAWKFIFSVYLVSCRPTSQYCYTLKCIQVHTKIFLLHILYFSIS